METLEGGVVSAPLFGALTPARGVHYLPSDPDDELQPSTIPEEHDVRSWDEQPTTVFVESFSIKAPVLISRSLAVMVGLLAFLSGALVSAIGLTTLKRPSAAALVQPARVEAETRLTPVPSPPQETASNLPELPPPAELLSLPASADPPAMTTPVAAPEVPPASKPKMRPKRPPRLPKAVPAIPTGSEIPWVDPFAE